MKLSYQNLAKRLYLNPIPEGDCAWNPPEKDIEVAREAIEFLETCSVLFDVYELKDTENTVNSVMDIRDFLNKLSKEVPYKNPLRRFLEGMREACNNFAEKIHIPGRIPIDPSYWWPNVNYFTGIGELRGVFGVYIAQIAVMYGIDVNGSITTLLPVRHTDVWHNKYLIHFMEKPSISQEPDGTYSARSHCPCGWSLRGNGKSKAQAYKDLWEFYEFHIIDHSHLAKTLIQEDKKKTK